MCPALHEGTRGHRDPPYPRYPWIRPDAGTTRRRDTQCIPGGYPPRVHVRAVDVLRWGPAGSPPAHTVAPSTYVVPTTGGWVTHTRSGSVSYSGRCGTGCVPLGAQMGTLMGTSRGPGSNAERDNPQMPGWMPRWAHLGPTLRPTDALVEWHADVPWQLWMWGCTVSPMQHVGLRTHGIHSVTGCPTVSTNTCSTGRMQGCYPHTPRMLPA